MIIPGFSPLNNGLLLWVPAVADVWHPSAGELSAGVDLTYALSDFRHEPAQVTRTVIPWSRRYEIEFDDGFGDTVEVTWPYSRVTPTVAQTTLVPGARGFVVWRLGYPKSSPVDVGQTVNAVIPVQVSVPRDMPPSTGVASKAQKLNVIGEVGREVVVV